MHLPSTQQAVAYQHVGGCSVVPWLLSPGGPGPVLVLVFLGPGTIPHQGGPWCLFLLVIGACHHPLTLPSLQAGACSGGNGWWVSVVMGFCFLGAEHISVTCCAYGAAVFLLGRYPPSGVSWCPSALSGPMSKASHLIEMGRRGLGGHGHVLGVFHHFTLLPVELQPKN